MTDPLSPSPGTAPVRPTGDGRAMGWTMPASLVVHGAVLAVLLLWPPQPVGIAADDVVSVELVTMAAASAPDSGGPAEPAAQEAPPGPVAQETPASPVQEAAVQEAAVPEPPPPEPVPAEDPPPPPPLTVALADLPPPEPPPPVDEGGLRPAPPPPPAPPLPEPPPPPPPQPAPPPRPRPAPPPERERPKPPPPRVVKAPAAPAAPSAPVAIPASVPAGAAAAPSPAAPAREGGSGSAPASAADFPPDYLTRLRAWLERHKRYPEQARMLRTQGVATVWFRMARDGTVLAWRIDRGSGSPLLDEAVRAMIESASPLPALPAEVAGGTLELRVPVAFRLTN